MAYHANKYKNELLTLKSLAIRFYPINTLRQPYANKGIM